MLNFHTQNLCPAPSHSTRPSSLFAIGVLFGMVLLGLISQAHAERVLAIVGNGRAKACINLYESGKSPVGGFAAQELRSYIEKITGIRLQARSLTLPNTWRPVSSVIVTLSPCEHENVLLPVQHLIASLYVDPPDSFLIKSTADSVIMAGNDARGSLYAVYAALERLGVRFLAPAFGFYHGYNEVIPHSRSLVFPETYSVEKPVFRFRKKYIDGAFSQTPENLPALLDWMAKNRLNILAASVKRQSQDSFSWDDYLQNPAVRGDMQLRGIIAEVGGHGYDTFIPPAEFPTAYHRLTDFPCFSHPGVLKAYIGKVIQYLKSHQEISIFDAWPPDGRRWCAEDIKKWGTPEEVQAQVIIHLDDEVKKVLPGVTVEMLSYAAAQNLPKTKLPPNIMVDFAAYDRSYSHNLFDPSDKQNSRFAVSLRAWADPNYFPGTLCYYSYYRKYSWDSRPVILTHLIAKEAREFGALRLAGLGSYAEPADWITYEFAHYLVARVSWSPDINTDRFLARYLSSRFGPAQLEMRTYYDAIEKAGEILFNSPDGAYASGSQDRLQRMEKALDKYHIARHALQRAADNTEHNPKAYFIIQRLEWNLDYTVLDLEAHIASASGEQALAEKLQHTIQEHVWRYHDDGIFLYPLYSERVKASRAAQAAHSHTALQQH